jgi:hypothetical protein
MKTLALTVLFGMTSATAWAQYNRAGEDEYYPILRYSPPPGAVLEVGGIEQMPDGKIAVSTRRGEIWMIDHAFEKDPKAATFSLWASGLHEVLGLAYRDGWLYCMQRCELTRIKDSSGRGRADLFRTVNDDWAISGDYHEYAFCSKPDREGNLWIVLCLTGSFTSDVPFRGWCVRITPEGKMIPTASGIRSPGGIGADADGEMFYCDNQGVWNGTNGLKHLVPGSFQGHPDTYKWYPLAPNMGPAPLVPKSGSRSHLEAERIKEYIPPPILIPYQILGNSASGIACDTTGGKFGPFQRQIFVSDQSFSVVNRCFLEKVKGRFQGACFAFRSGWGSGNVPELMTPDGSLFVGGTNRGWGSRGNLQGAIERCVWTGKVPFEVLEMRAKPDGFEFVFTKPVDRATVENVASYKARTFTYIYQAAYGSPEVDLTTPVVKSVKVSEDGLRARMVIDRLVVGNIHEFKLSGVRSAEGAPLLHDAAWYTLWNIPPE